MSNDIKTVSRDLNLAKVETNKLRKELHASPLWKQYQEALRKESKLEQQLKCLQLKESKAELEKEFEFVSGHEYYSYYYKFLIVHKDCPHITSIDKEDGLWEIGCKGKTVLPRDANCLILGSSDTEEAAWRTAIFNWNEMNQDERDALCGK